MNEDELIEILQNSKSVLLVEPNYKRKYPPLGLMKIASYLKFYNKKYIFSRTAIQGDYDLICCTTLFTYDYDIVYNTITELRFLNPSPLIIIGGVAASVNKNKFINIIDNCLIFTGYSNKLDQFPPDYDCDFMIDDKWQSYSYLFTTRGCPNSCAYCFVPKIEKMNGVIPGWERHININRKNVMIYDNNITAFGSEHIWNVGRFLKSNKLKTRLDNAIDCKYIDNDMAMALASLPIEKRGYRTAFDRIEEDGIFQQSIKNLINVGISKYNIMAYVLFNFNDTPREADYRARECAKLGITPYPACFQPLNAYSRNKKYISKNWTSRLTTAFMHFWLYNSIYMKHEFIEYAKGEGRERYRLTDDDFEKWVK